MARRWSSIRWLRPQSQQPLLEEKEQQLQPADASDELLFDERVRQHCRRLLTIPNALFLLSVFLNLLFMLCVNLDSLMSSIFDVNMFCSLHESNYRSPLDDEVPVRYTPVQFNSSLTKESIYAMSASDEVDQAWHDLGVNTNHFILPESEDPTLYGISEWQAKRDPEEGGGYIVFTEALHQLHCLNMLRMLSHADYDYYWQKGKDEPGNLFNRTEYGLRMHTYHCIDMLRERIMCSADRAIFGMVWIDGDGHWPAGAFAQYSTERKCRNFDDVKEWVAEKNIHEGWKEAKFREGDKIYSQKDLSIF